MQNYRKKKIKRVILFILSTVLITSLIISIIFGIFNIKFSLDEDNVDNDEECKRWKYPLNQYNTVEDWEIGLKELNYYQTKELFKIKILKKVDDSCEKNLVTRGQPCEGLIFLTISNF